MTRILMIKFGALGDVLRTTSVLAGLRARYGETLELVWVTAPDALALLEGLRASSGPITELLAVDLDDAAGLDRVREELARRPFDRVLSFDDEPGACSLALPAAGGNSERIVGAYLNDEGRSTYTEAAAEWFDMGLISKLGKAAADRLKIENQRSHPAIFASMLGIEPGEPELVLAEAPRRVGDGLLIGLNTGAGGRWRSKALPEERVVALARRLDQEVLASEGRRPTFVLLGGPEERERNARLRDQLGKPDGVDLIDPGCDNSLPEFAGLIAGLDLLITSDSMALHMATAKRVPIVAFFAPTSAAEIDLFGRGQKVASTAPDACSYARDADTSTLTVERLVEAVMRTLSTK